MLPRVHGARLAVSCILAFGLSASGIWLAAAGPGDAPASAPLMIHPGDMARYEFHPGEPEREATSGSSISVRLGSPFLMQDGLLNWHIATPLHWQAELPPWPGVPTDPVALVHEHTDFVDLERGVLIASHDDVAWWTGDADRSVDAIPARLETHHDQRLKFHDETDCLVARWEAPGQTTCTWRSLDEWLPTELDSIWTGSGDDVRALDGGQIVFLRSEAGLAQVTYAASVSLPVRVEFQRDDTTLFDIRMTGWARDDEPSKDAALRPSQRKNGSAPLAGTGLLNAPQDQRVDSPWIHFTLTDALEIGLSPTGQTVGLGGTPPDAVQQFISAHPDAWVRAARLDYRVYEVADARLEWTFILDDGIDAQEFTISRATILQPELATLVTYFVERSPMHIPALPCDAPSTYPDLRAAIHRAQQHPQDLLGGLMFPNGWSFGSRNLCPDGSITIRDHMGDTTGTGPVQAMLGVDAAPLPTDSSRSNLAAVHFSPDGRIVERTESVRGGAYGGNGSLIAPTLWAPPDQPPTEMGQLKEPGGGLTVEDIGVWTGLGILASALFYLLPSIKHGALGLFSRLPDSCLLENPQRAAVLQAVRGTPGAHFREIVRTTGAGNGATLHHLRRLEAGGLIESRRVGRLRCYFATEGPAIDLLPEAGRSPTAQAVLKVLRPGEPLTLDEIRHRAGLARSTAHYRLQKLEDAGLLKSGRNGRAKRWFLP